VWTTWASPELILLVGHVEIIKRFKRPVMRLELCFSTTASAEFVLNGITSSKELRCSVPGFFCLYAAKATSLHGVLLIVISSLLLIQIVFDRYTYT
jgi:hypothetical protein